jgi:peptide/nickel transport system permease protein
VASGQGGLTPLEPSGSAEGAGPLVAEDAAGPAATIGSVGVGLDQIAASRHPLASFLLRRGLLGIVTVLVASFVIFAATNALPGNVAYAVLGKSATPQTVHSIEAQLGLNRPLLARYWSWLSGAAHGDLGYSAVQLAQSSTKVSVTSLIGTPLRNSAILAAITIILLIPLSMAVGTLSAIRAGTATDYAVSYVSLVLNALPEFVLGTFLILILFNTLNLLPPVALVPPGSSPLSHPSALVLPVLTLLGVSLAFSARQVRAGVIESLRQEYVPMARLNGIRERRVVWRYGLRNALAPAVQTFAQTIQYLLGGIIVVEALFAYPGIGQELVQSVSVRDVTVVAGITLVLAVLYIVINICADFVVVLLIPKLRTAVK